MMTVSELKKSHPENLERLCLYLGLETEGYSHRHRAKLEDQADAALILS